MTETLSHRKVQIMSLTKMQPLLHHHNSSRTITQSFSQVLDDWFCVFILLQTIVQRSLAAKNISHAKGGALMAALLKITPMYLIVMPGMIARILLPSKKIVLSQYTSKLCLQQYTLTVVLRINYLIIIKLNR